MKAVFHGNYVTVFLDDLAKYEALKMFSNKYFAYELKKWNPDIKAYEYIMIRRYWFNPSKLSFTTFRGLTVRVKRIAENLKMGRVEAKYRELDYDLYEAKFLRKYQLEALISILKQLEFQGAATLMATTGCVDPKTIVITKEGAKTISEVKEGEEVLAFDFMQERIVFAKVLKKWKVRHREAIVIETEKRRIKCTPEHRFWTSRGWVEAKDLKIGDEITALGGISETCCGDRYSLFSGNNRWRWNNIHQSGLTRPKLQGTWMETRLGTLSSTRNYKLIREVSELVNPKVSTIKARSTRQKSSKKISRKAQQNIIPCLLDTQKSRGDTEISFTILKGKKKAGRIASKIYSIEKRKMVKVVEGMLDATSSQKRKNERRSRKNEERAGLLIRGMENLLGVEEIKLRRERIKKIYREVKEGQETVFYDLTTSLGNYFANGILVHNSGKTEIAVALHKVLKPRKTFFLSLNTDLLIQARDRFRKYGVEAGLVNKDYFQIDREVVCCTAQTLLRAIKKVEKITEKDIWGYDIEDIRLEETDVLDAKKLVSEYLKSELVIVDEVHHLPCYTVRTCTMFHPNSLRVGLSATPWRSDGFDLEIYAVCGDIVPRRITSSELIELGYLVPVKIYFAHYFPPYAKKYEKMRGGPWLYNKVKKEVYNDNVRNRKIAELATKVPKPFMILVKEISHGEKITEECRRLGLKVAFLYGQVDPDIRAMIFNLVRGAKIDGIICTTLADRASIAPA